MTSCWRGCADRDRLSFFTIYTSKIQKVIYMCPNEPLFPAKYICLRTCYSLLGIFSLCRHSRGRSNHPRRIYRLPCSAPKSGGIGTTAKRTSVFRDASRTRKGDASAYRERPRSQHQGHRRLFGLGSPSTQEPISRQPDQRHFDLPRRVKRQRPKQAGRRHSTAIEMDRVVDRECRCRR